MTNCIDTIHSEQACVVPSLTWNNWFKAGLDLLVQDLIKLTDLIGEWSNRDASRHILMTADERMLDDLAWSRATVMNETAKPFWRE